MAKPITVAKEDFASSVVKLVNESGLPAFVIRGVLKDLDAVLAQLEAEQLKADTAEWESQQKDGEDG